MAANKRIKMDIENRAKQFMPFAALKGLPEALLQKEKIVVVKPQLSEEYLEHLNQIMHLVTKGMIVEVTYYYKEECLKKTGIVARVDTDCRVLQIVDTKISFDDILNMEIIEN